MSLTPAIVAVLLVCSVATAAGPTTSATTAPHRLRIVLAGDSTVTDKDGWGRGFANLVTADTEVANFASGGRSSKSFRDEGKWAAALKGGGDFILIQFGHNDIPGKGPERETDAATTFKANLLRFVADARAAGMRPVLVTSLVRRYFGPDGKITPETLAPYVVAAKAAAKEADVPLIDLYASSIAYFEKLGEAECERVGPRDHQDATKPDRTHLSPPWHEPVASLVVDELAKVVPELAPHLKRATK